MRTITLNQFFEEATQRFGEDIKKWRFVCPRCQTVQTAQDFIDAGVKTDEVNKIAGVSCIGRFDDDKGCDWTLGGLLKIHTLEIITDDNKNLPCFELDKGDNHE